MAHTPGPFETALSVSNLALVEIKARKGKKLVRIASVEGNDMAHNSGHPIPANEALANAALFAAAPDLLAACKAAYSLLGPQHAGPSLEVSQMLAAAIARAEQQGGGR